jgi:hypothetical protein
VYRSGIVILAICLLAGNVQGADSLAVSSAPWKPSPTGAAFRSLALPGWGQSYNRRPLKAVIIGGLEQGVLFGIYRNHQLFRDARKFADDRSADFYKDQRNRLTWILAGTLLYSAVDAFVDAHLYDFEVDDPASENRPASTGLRLSFGIILP